MGWGLSVLKGPKSIEYGQFLYPSPMVRKVSDAIRGFLATESAGGILLLIATSIAIVSANTSLSTNYLKFWNPLQNFANTWLISLFFFLVGLEIKREFLSGNLRSFKSASFPIFAAMGGMITPALIFSYMNRVNEAGRGWAIAMPTDVALAIGMLALLGSRINISLKIFLLTLAIADDLGSIFIMGIFYSQSINLSEIASTFGAVALAWVLPSRGKITTDRLIELIHPWSSFFVIPVFALANLGIALSGLSLTSAWDSHVVRGLVVARVIGKIAGITFFAWFVVKLGVARKPDDLTFMDIAGVGALAGMGLTVALIIANLSYQSPEMILDSKIGLLVTAVISSVIGLGILLLSNQTPRK